MSLQCLKIKVRLEIMRSKEYLAIFDLDGTLFDTGEANFYAYKEALMLYGIKIEYDYFVSNCNGKHYKEFLPHIMKSQAYIEEVHKAKKECYSKYLDKVKINLHLFEIINSIKKHYHICIVTTASRRNTIEILKYHKCEDLFELLVTQEDVCNVKPNPEGFLKAMNYFEKEAKNTMIFEDSSVGIEAARRTGASVFAINQF